VQVFSVLEDPGQVDLATLDVDDLLNRFQNLCKQRFKPQVLETYKRRFRSALKSYKQYLENPGTWKPASQERSANTERRQRASSAPRAPQEQTVSLSSRPVLNEIGTEEYRLPLRPRVMARLILPVDLSPEEAQRIKVFVDMLVVPDTQA
jgi:hypothetical protein